MKQALTCIGRGEQAAREKLAEIKQMFQ